MTALALTLLGISLPHDEAPERCYLNHGEAAVLRRNVRDALRASGFEVIADSKPLPGQVR